jgi:hypothetical protein
MKRIFLVVLFLAFSAALPALAAEIPAGTASPSLSAPTAGPVTAPFWASSSSQEIHLVVACLFPRCPIYPDYGCSCEWVLCNGNYTCGIPPSFSAASRLSLHL